MRAHCAGTSARRAVATARVPETSNIWEQNKWLPLYSCILRVGLRIIEPLGVGTEEV